MISMVNLENTLFDAAFFIYVAASLFFFLHVSRFKNNSRRAGTPGNSVNIENTGIIGKTAMTAVYSGFLLHTGAMVLRSIEAGRLPFSNQFEFAASFAWGIVLCFIVLHWMYRYTVIGAFVFPLAFLVMGYASLQSRDIRPLMPALQSYWLTVHVGAAVLSYGAFAVACGTAVMCLMDAGKPEGRRILQDPEAGDVLTYRLIAFGFLMLTLVIVSGALWAQRAWSRYWAWDPKETWSLVTWIIYGVYLHLRLRRSWRGKAAAWFAVIGFISVLFTFIGVNVLLPSIHSYA